MDSARSRTFEGLAQVTFLLMYLRVFLDSVHSRVISGYADASFLPFCPYAFFSFLCWPGPPVPGGVEMVATAGVLRLSLISGWNLQCFTVKHYAHYRFSAKGFFHTAFL